MTTHIIKIPGTNYIKSLNVWREASEPSKSNKSMTVANLFSRLYLNIDRNFWMICCRLEYYVFASEKALLKGFNYG